MDKTKSHSIKLNSEVWRNINWRKVNLYVFKLQKRIYKASQCGDIKSVRKLQRTLRNSWYARLAAVRQVTQENKGKKTAGVDGVKALTPAARLKLAGQLRLTGKAKSLRRVWIPKPGRDEKRPLGIPVMFDRALQALLKLCLEPEWEAQFEPNSYGFRPGRSIHDAICQIKISIQNKAKYCLDADISKCFDKINHQALLAKTGTSGKTKRQIKAWLEAGVMDDGKFQSTDEGTPQGGVISPLLANIALHGLEEILMEYIKEVPLRYPNGGIMRRKDRITSLTFVRYADDFVVLHYDKSVILKCQEIITNWLAGIGLSLKPEKTRLTHSLRSNLSEDGKAGFDFLGYHIFQHEIGKNSQHTNAGKKIEYKTFLIPSKKNQKTHYEKIKNIIDKYRNAPQEALIGKLNPLIRGWCNNFSYSDAKSKGTFSRMHNLTYLKLRAWGNNRCGTQSKAAKKYWGNIKGKPQWNFNTPEGLELVKHSNFEASSTKYVKVKGNRSPFDGDWSYWATRMGQYPGIKPSVAKLLKRQKGICPWCGLMFKFGDNIEVDHIVPKVLGGKDSYKNLQALHDYCHDEKTKTDGSRVRKTKTEKQTPFEKIWSESVEFEKSSDKR